jgi:hypothetical protein
MMKLIVITVIFYLGSTYGFEDFVMVDDNPDNVCDVTASGMRYKFFPGVRKRWVDARDACIEDSGSLVTISDAALHKRFRRHINKYSGALMPQGKGYWTGLNDRIVEGSFIFTHDDSLLSYNSGWNSRKIGFKIITQPNNNVVKDRYGQDCVQLWREPKKGKKKPTWDFDDAYCSDKKSYICMYETDSECAP